MIGIAAIALLAISAALFLFSDADALDSGWQQLTAACLRVGLTMGALWLAWPQLERLPSWLIVGVFTGLVLLALRPKLFPVALVIAIGVSILRPRRRPTETSRP